MLIISDTNILSSFAAGGVFSLLLRLFPNSVIYIPPAVQQELQVGLERGRIYLETILQAIGTNKLQVLTLSPQEQLLLQSLPKKLNMGECEAIVLSQNRQARLLSNDKRVVHYCQEKSIKVVDLLDLLRLLWTRGIISPAEVSQLIEQMERVENLRLSQTDRTKVFAPRSPRHHKS